MIIRLTSEIRLFSLALVDLAQIICLLSIATTRLHHSIVCHFRDWINPEHSIEHHRRDYSVPRCSFGSHQQVRNNNKTKFTFGHRKRCLIRKETKHLFVLLFLVFRPVLICDACLCWFFEYFTFKIRRRAVSFVSVEFKRNKWNYRIQKR